MSTQYTVRATPEAQQAGAVALAVASLPESFRPADFNSQADIHVISGRPGWTAETLQDVNAGTRAIVIVNPVPEDTGKLQSMATAAGTVVVLDQRWASNPAIPVAEDAIRSMASRAAILDSVAIAPLGTSSSELLADHLAAVVRLTGPLGNLTLLTRGPHGYTAMAMLPNDAPVAMQGIVSNARPAGVTINLLTDDGGVRIVLPEPIAAWPASVKVIGPQGEVLLPTLYESAHRATWRLLKMHLDAGTVPSDLHRFAAMSESIATFT